MDDRIVVSVWVAQIGVVITMFGILWRSFTHHKDKVQYKENCREITTGFTNEVKRLGELMESQFKSQEKLEEQKMQFYKEQIQGLVNSNQKVEDKVEKLLNR